MTVIRVQKPLLGKLRLINTITVETGLHIGGGGETLDIGGLDKSVIRDPITQQPYLPGSSIKGKLRATLERLLNKPLNRAGGSGTYRYESDDLVDGFTEVGKDEKQYIPFEGASTCEVSRLFGSTGGANCCLKPGVVKEAGLDDKGSVTINGERYIKTKGRNSPARLIVRDAHLLPESAQQLKKIDTGLFMTEWKFENGLDRITAAANPRQLERVPAGAKFHFELVYTVEDKTQAVEDLKNIAIALAILEDDALGGHGSRGYGKVRFENFKFFYRSLEQYRQITTAGTNFSEPILALEDTAALLERFGELSGQVERLLPSGE